MPLPSNANVTENQSIYYGIRPEHLLSSKQALAMLSSKDASGAAHGIVRVVEPTGPEIHIYAKLGDKDICAISRERVNWSPGDVIHLQPELEYVHLFDAETEVAL